MLLRAHHLLVGEILAEANATHHRAVTSGATRELLDLHVSINVHHASLTEVRGLVHLRRAAHQIMHDVAPRLCSFVRIHAVAPQLVSHDVPKMLACERVECRI